MPHGHTGVGLDAGHPRRGPLWVLVRAYPRIDHIWKSARFVEILSPVIVIPVSRAGSSVFYDAGGVRREQKTAR